jgi:hypothetical protein
VHASASNAPLPNKAIARAFDFFDEEDTEAREERRVKIGAIAHATKETKETRNDARRGSAIDCSAVLIVIDCSLVFVYLVCLCNETSTPQVTKNDAKLWFFSHRRRRPFPPNGTRRFVVTIVSKTKERVRRRKTSGRDRFWRAHRGDGAYFAVVFVRREEDKEERLFFQRVSQTRVYLRGFGYDERGENRAIRAGRSARRNEWRVQESFRPESERGWTELFHERFYNVVGVLALLESVLEDETRRDINERTRDVRPGNLGVFSRESVRV